MVKRATYPSYKGKKYTGKQRGTKAAKKAVMKRAGVLRKHIAPSSAMSRAWKDVCGGYKL